MALERYGSATSHDRFYDLGAIDPVFKNSLADCAAYRMDEVLELLTGEYTQDWKKARGLNILDLGCGSSYVIPSVIFSEGYREEPYFCRLMGANGATVYGVDQYPGFEEDKVLYTHITSDLIEVVANNALPKLPELNGIKFDVIHSSRFSDDLDTSPDLDRDLLSCNYSLYKFRQEMKDQSAQLLRDGGLLLFEDKAFTMKEEILVPIKRRKDRLF